MADPRPLASALAPFQRCRDVLLAADARLTDLLATCAREGVQRIERLNRIPAAAQFTPFDALSTPGAQAKASASAATAQDAGGSRSGQALPPADRQPASAGTARSAARAGMASFVRQAPARAAGAPFGANAGGDATPSAAWGMNTDRQPPAGTPASGHGAATLPTAESAHAAIARDAGELIGELLLRHAAPRRPPRLQGIGARPAAVQALAGADAAAALQPTRLGAPRAATLPESVQRGSASAAQHTGDTRAFATRDALFATPSSQPPRAAQMPPEPGSATDQRAPASLLQSGNDSLRALVTPLFLRPTSGPDASAHATGSTAARSTDRPPLLRAPSRLLAGTTPATAAAAPTPGTQAATAAPAFAANAAAVSMPTLSMPTLSPTLSMPANSAADVATGLDRLLREQAWLRGVDLT